MNRKEAASAAFFPYAAHGCVLHILALKTQSVICSYAQMACSICDHIVAFPLAPPRKGELLFTTPPATERLVADRVSLQGEKQTDKLCAIS